MHVCVYVCMHESSSPLFIHHLYHLNSDGKLGRAFWNFFCVFLMYVSFWLYTSMYVCCIYVLCMHIYIDACMYYVCTYYVCLFICMYIFIYALIVCLSFWLSVCLYVCLFVCLLICIFVALCDVVVFVFTWMLFYYYVWNLM